MTSDTSVSGIRQVAITVGDVAAATAFYRDAVGLPFLFAAGPSLAFLSAGDVRIMLGAPEGGFTPGGGMVLYFTVSDIIGAHREMTARGVPFSASPHLIASMPDHDLWLAAFTDPDGNALALMAERPKGST